MPRKAFGLTTSDNPYDVFDEHLKWQIFDHQKGYFTDEYLARIAFTSDSLTDEQYNYEIEQAIDEIIKLNNPSEDSENVVKYVKVVKTY